MSACTVPPRSSTSQSDNTWVSPMGQEPSRTQPDPDSDTWEIGRHTRHGEASAGGASAMTAVDSMTDHQYVTEIRQLGGEYPEFDPALIQILLEDQDGDMFDVRRSLYVSFLLDVVGG